jgi:hypothetical protein
MIRHIVLLSFATDDGVIIHRVMSELQNFIQLKYPGTTSHFGNNCSIEKLDQGFTHALTVTFPDVGSRDRYVADPEHHRIAQKIIAHLRHIESNDHPTVAVVDIEETSPPLSPRTYAQALKLLAIEAPSQLKAKKEDVLAQLQTFEMNKNLYERVVVLPGIGSCTISPVQALQEARELVAHLI